MDKTEGQQYADSLRLLADWFDAHPEMPPPTDSISVYALDTREEAARCLRALGSCTKKYSDWSFDLVKSFGTIQLRYIFSRANVCERKVIGVETVPAQFVEAHTIPASTRDIVEWDCGPILEPTEAEKEADHVEL